LSIFGLILLYERRSSPRDIADIARSPSRGRSTRAK
jgi:hypothetical protein